MRHKQYHLDHNLVIRPYVILCGESLSKISASYVVVKQPLMYQVASPVLAFDLCLQFVLVLDTDFSRVPDHIWLFLKNFVNGIELTKSEKLPQTVITVIHDLKLLP